MRLSPRTRAWATLVGAVVLVLVAVLLSQLGSTSSAPGSTPGAGVVTTRATSAPVPPPSRGSGAATDGIALSSLDVQARRTVALIRAGGPFPYPRNDGVTYHNANHALPSQRDGYYREYTVPTPGSSSRGARRVVVGGGAAFFYTSDHYETFRLVDLTR